jgi:hypothetical protein
MEFDLGEMLRIAKKKRDFGEDTLTIEELYMHAGFRSNRSSAADESDSAAPVVSAAAAGTLTLPSGLVRTQPFPMGKPLSRCAPV